MKKILTILLCSLCCIYTWGADVTFGITRTIANSETTTDKNTSGAAVTGKQVSGDIVVGSCDDVTVALAHKLESPMTDKARNTYWYDGSSIKCFVDKGTLNYRNSTQTLGDNNYFAFTLKVAEGKMIDIKSIIADIMMDGDNTSYQVVIVDGNSTEVYTSTPKACRKSESAKTVVSVSDLAEDVKNSLSGMTGTITVKLRWTNTGNTGKYCVIKDFNVVTTVGDVPVAYYSINYSLGESGAMGVAPAAIVDENIMTKHTIPTNKTIYKEGYTLTGWTDGENTYNVGTQHSFSEGAYTLTPVFRQNTKTLADTEEEVNVHWEFRTNQGAPTLAAETNTKILVTQASVNGDLIDLCMTFNATNGKFNNSNGDWAQVNPGTIITFPATAGTVVRSYIMNEPKAAEKDGGAKTTLDGSEYTSFVSNIATWTAAPTDGISTLTVQGGSWYGYMDMVVPAKSKEDPEPEPELTTVSVVKAVLNGGTNAPTVTGKYAGSAVAKTQNTADATAGGYKFDNGNYVGLTLAQGYTFKKGDTLHVKVTKASTAGQRTPLALYSDLGTNLICATNITNETGDQTFTLTEAFDALSTFYLYRSTNYGWNGYVESVEVVGLDRSPIQQEYSVNYSLGESGATGVLPTSITGESILTKFSAPVNKTIYKEGYTLTGWTDGVNEYLIGQSYTMTEGTHNLTPVFTANTKTFSDLDAVTEVIWKFGRSNDAPSFDGSASLLVQQASLNGVSTDLAVIMAGGDNSGRNDEWMNNQQKNMTVPVCAGAVVEAKVFYTNNAVFNGETLVYSEEVNGPQGNVIYTYTCPSNVGTTIDVNVGNQFLSYIKVTYPIYVEPEPETKTIYLKSVDGWGENAYVYDITNGTWTAMVKGTECYGGYFVAEVPTSCNGIVFVKQNSWNGNTTQTIDFECSTNNLFVMAAQAWVEGSGDYGKYTGSGSIFALPTYTITYQPGIGGTGSMKAVVVTCGDELTVPDNGFTVKSGFTFTGWNDGENTYSAGETFVVSANKTLTAQWTVGNRNIYLKPNVWESDGAKYAIYYINKESWSDFMVKTACGDDVYYVSIPADVTSVNIARLAADATVPTWDKKWNQTANITLSEDVDCYRITAYGNNGADCPYEASKYVACTDIFTLTSSSANLEGEKITISGGSPSNNGYGFEANGTLTITAAEGYVVTGATITYSASDNNRVGGEPTVSDGYGYSRVEVEVTGTIALNPGKYPLQTVNLDFTNKARITYMVVTYALRSDVSVALSVSGTVGYGTFIAPYDVVLPEGLIAYTATTATATTVTMTELELTSRILPAGTPVVLKNTTSETISQNYNAFPTTNATTSEGNLLVGSYELHVVPGNTYLLQYKNGVVSFNHVAADNTTLTIGVNRCYLQLPEAVGSTPERLVLVLPNSPIATDVEAVNKYVDTKKMLVRGQLVIVRDGKMFDVNGALVK